MDTILLNMILCNKYIFSNKSGTKKIWIMSYTGVISDIICYLIVLYSYYT